MFNTLRMKTVCKTTGLLPFRVSIEKVEKKPSINAEEVGSIVGRRVARVIKFTKDSVKISTQIAHASSRCVCSASKRVTPVPVKKFWSGFKSNFKSD